MQEIKYLNVDDIRNKNKEEYIEVSGTELSICVAMLHGHSSKKTSEDLLELYYRYILQGKNSGFVSSYIKLQIKDLTESLLHDLQTSSYKTFREICKG
mgnify:CR=1 FL=1|jgi:hypothetical protein